MCVASGAQPGGAFSFAADCGPKAERRFEGLSPVAQYYAHSFNDNPAKWQPLRARVAFAPRATKKGPRGMQGKSPHFQTVTILRWGRAAPILYPPQNRIPNLS